MYTGDMGIARCGKIISVLSAQLQLNRAGEPSREKRKQNLIVSE